MSYFLNQDSELSSILPSIEQINQAKSFQAVTKALLALSKHLPHLPETLKTTENEVQGCETTTWMIKSNQDIAADSNSRLMRGILLLLVLNYFNEDLIDVNSIAKQLNASKKLAWERLNTVIQ